jgi:TonB family protein
MRQFPPSNSTLGETLLRFALSITIPQRLFSVIAALSTFVPASHAAEAIYIPPIPIVTTEALYPVNSLAVGTVTLTVVVEDDGRVSEAKVLKSIPSLDEPSVRAARQWRFEPARLDGRRVRSSASISFVYDRGLFRTVGKPRK